MLWERSSWADEHLPNVSSNSTIVIDQNAHLQRGILLGEWTSKRQVVLFSGHFLSEQRYIFTELPMKGVLYPTSSFFFFDRVFICKHECLPLKEFQMMSEGKQTQQELHSFRSSDKVTRSLVQYGENGQMFIHATEQKNDTTRKMKESLIVSWATAASSRLEGEETKRGRAKTYHRWVANSSIHTLFKFHFVR